MNTRSSDILRMVSGAALGVILAATLATTATAQIATVADPAMAERVAFDPSGTPVSGMIAIAQGQSQVIEFDGDISHTLIANPDVADIIPMTDRSIYVLGKAKGTTSLTVTDADKTLRGVFTVDVTHDIAAIRRGLFEAMPKEAIEVRSSGDSVILSGRATSPAAAAMAARIVEQHGVTKVLNTVDTGQSQQVMLQVRIAEVDRTVAKRMNLSTRAFYSTPKDFLDVASGIIDIESFVTGIGRVQLGEFDVDFIFDALDQEGLVSTLAEPSLVAMNGETAYFLAGGEFPIPVGSQVQDGGALQVRIEFKEFGVKLAYTPTIVGDTINLVIEPEVSALDPQNGIVLNSITIPGLTTRRASTTVEMKNGQTFAIAGLLNDEFQTEVQGIPGFSRLPIIGALARSPRYERNETELLILVTPFIVEPYEGSDYRLPTDFVDRPSEADLFLGGHVEMGRTP